MYMLHLSVAYDMNTKKHGIGHTQHREGDFKFFLCTFSQSQPQLCNFVRRSGGTVVEEKNTCFECQPIRIKSTYADALSDWTTITKAV